MYWQRANDNWLNRIQDQTYMQSITVTSRTRGKSTSTEEETEEESTDHDTFFGSRFKVDWEEHIHGIWVDVKNMIAAAQVLWYNRYVW